MSESYVDTSIDLPWEEARSLLGERVTARGLDIGTITSVEMTVRQDRYPAIQYRLWIQGNSWVDIGRCRDER